MVHTLWVCPCSPAFPSFPCSLSGPYNYLCPRDQVSPLSRGAEGRVSYLCPCWDGSGVRELLRRAGRTNSEANAPPPPGSAFSTESVWGERGKEGPSPTHWTWVWASSGRWWRTDKPGMLPSTGSQRVGHDWATQQPQLGKGGEQCLHTGPSRNSWHLHSHLALDVPSTWAFLWLNFSP